MAKGKLPGFIKQVNESLLFNDSGEFVFYVPESYFDRAAAIVIGEYVDIIGILNYAIFNTAGKNSGLKTFNFPTMFTTKPSVIETVKNLKLTGESIATDYRLLKYKKDDMIVVSVKVPQGIENVEMFYRQFVLTGNIPTTIPYDKLQNYFIESMQLNGSSYGMSIQLFGVILSELCRSTTSDLIPFRLSGEKNMHKYKSISVLDIPKYISPYASITSGNWDEAVVNAILDKPGKESPLERILMA